MNGAVADTELLGLGQQWIYVLWGIRGMKGSAHFCTLCNLHRFCMPHLIHTGPVQIVSESKEVFHEKEGGGCQIGVKHYVVI